MLFSSGALDQLLETLPAPTLLIYLVPLDLLRVQLFQVSEGSNQVEPCPNKNRQMTIRNLPNLSLVRCEGTWSVLSACFVPGNSLAKLGNSSSATQNWYYSIKLSMNIKNRNIANIFPSPCRETSHDSPSNITIISKVSGR